MGGPYRARTERLPLGAVLSSVAMTPGCERAALMDPRPIFGAPRNWPSVGQSYRFRCQCGHRVARVSYTDNADQVEGPISPAALKLWF